MRGGSSGPWRAVLGDERAQVLPSMAVMLVALLGLCALVIDLGRWVVSERALQSATDAAALAGAQNLPNNTTAIAKAMQYSSVSGNLNAIHLLSGATMAPGYPKLVCVAALQRQGLPCLAPANANAVEVQQTLKVQMFFAELFGTKTLTLTATGTAAMKGGQPAPANVAIIVDTTGSMNDFDSDSNCNSTRINCALNGVQVLLSELSPCGASPLGCGLATGGNVATAFDKVSLFTFPGVASATEAQKAFDCTASQPAIAPYRVSPMPTYQIVDFSSDYRTSDLLSVLNGASNLVVAVGGNPSCPGMQAPGGMGTYYAGVIYAAQAALAARATPQTQSVMILLSDGDSYASPSAMPGASTSSGTYPSTIQQCQQAVTAAQAAAAAGTLVYSIAYGATSSGCSTDTSGITPCQTMQRIASSSQYFFSDYTASAGDGSCISASQPTTNLGQIFAQISANLSYARLIPNGTP